MSQLARAPAAFTYPETTVNTTAYNAKQQLYRNASAWNEPRRKAAYLAAFQQKYGRAPRNGLNYTLGEHQYNSMPPGVSTSNNLVKLYQASKTRKTRKNRKNSRKATRRNRRSN